MTSSIVEESLKVGRRELMYKIGLEGENEVGIRLSKLFGFRNVSLRIEGFSEGTNGYPDISLINNDNLFYIEVKSMQPFVKRYGKNVSNRINGVKYNRGAWNRLKERAKSRKATIIMIVEVRLLGEYDYFIIDYDSIEDLFMSKPDVELLEIPLHYIMMKCKKLEWIDSEFIVNPIETNQVSLPLD